MGNDGLLRRRTGVAAIAFATATLAFGGAASTASAASFGSGPLSQARSLLQLVKSQVSSSSLPGPTKSKALRNVKTAQRDLGAPTPGISTSPFGLFNSLLSTDPCQTLFTLDRALSSLQVDESSTSQLQPAIDTLRSFEERNCLE
jgi:hypothetical protein